MSDGFPLAQTIDDGSDPGLVFAGSLARDSLSGWDLTTGRQRWAIDLQLRSPPSLVVRRVLVGAADGLHVLDARTGSPLWATSVPSPSDASFVTDGTAVAVLEDVPGGHRAIRAYGLADGQRWWSVAVDDAVDSLVEHGGHIFGVTSRQLVAYG